jgi:predicted dienelactone hydrolase
LEVYYVSGFQVVAMKYTILWFIVQVSVSLSASLAHAAGNTRKVLPPPSGSFGVSRIAFDWVDESRPETAVKNASTRREILVYVWYPTDRKNRGTSSAYFPGADKVAHASESNDVKEFWGDVWPDIVSGQVTTQTLERAQIASGKQLFPLLLFSPGLGLSSTAYTFMMQQLVSHGYVVASIEPTYEVAAVAFPDGRVVTENAEATGRGPSPAKRDEAGIPQTPACLRCGAFK